VVNALVGAKKDRDFVLVPGMKHGISGRYGTRKRNDFFVKHLLVVEPPDWNGTDRAEAGGSRYEGSPEFAPFSATSGRILTAVGPREPCALRTPW
jgi:hypothetical protein